MAAATIKLFLPDGDAQGLRIAELSNWTGKVLAAPRSELESILAREELRQSGVYFLFGTDTETGKLKAYIGEGEDVGKRLRQHRDKEFWIQVVVFVSKDENLTKSHIRYLEGRLIEEAKKAGRFILENDQDSGAKLPEADREDMEVFLSKILQLLPILGCDIFIPAVTDEPKSLKTDVFTFKIKGLEAMGKRTAKGFIVVAGSQATKQLRPSAPAWVIQMRERLIKEGILTEETGDTLCFQESAEFASPSAAAAVVCGGHVNGLTAWKNGSGKTLKEIEASI
jgi:hypothetical protein